MSKKKEPIIIKATKYLERFFDACTKTDIEESAQEEYYRYKRPYNFFRNIKNNDCV